MFGYKRCNIDRFMNLTRYECRLSLTLRRIEVVDEKVNNIDNVGSDLCFSLVSNKTEFTILVSCVCLFPCSLIEDRLLSFSTKEYQFRFNKGTNFLFNSIVFYDRVYLNPEFTVSR